MTEHVTEILRWVEKCQGRKNAMTAQSLARLTGLPEREVRQIISDLRDVGHPIASAVNPPRGYYIPKTIEEAKECQRHMHSRVRQIKKAAKPIDDWIKRQQSRQQPLPL